MKASTSQKSAVVAKKTWNMPEIKKIVIEEITSLGETTPSADFGGYS